MKTDVHLSENQKDSQLWRGSDRASRRCAVVQDSPDPEGSAGSGHHRRLYSDSCPARPDREPSPRNLPPPSPGSRSAEEQWKRKRGQQCLKVFDSSSEIQMILKKRDLKKKKNLQKETTGWDPVQYSIILSFSFHCKKRGEEHPNTLNTWMMFLIRVNKDKWINIFLIYQINVCKWILFKSL